MVPIVTKIQTVNNQDRQKPKNDYKAKSKTAFAEILAKQMDKVSKPQ